MNFNVNSAVFIDAIKSANDVSTKNVTKDFKYGEKITIQAKKDEVVLLSYNGGVSLISPISASNFDNIEYNCSEEGRATVLANNLSDALSSLPKETVNFSLANNEVSVSLVSDSDCFRNLTTFDEYVEIPSRGDKSDICVKVDREAFLKSFERVSFAVSEEDSMFQYQCILLGMCGNKIQLISGNGSRFVVDRMKWASQSFGDEESKIFIPKQNISNIKKCLSEASCEYITICHWPSDTKNGSAEQLTIEFDGMTICVYNLEIYRSYPDVDRILKYNYTNSIFSSLKDWTYAVNGSLMTKRTHEDTIHNTEVRYDRKKNRLLVESRTKHKSKTTIPVPQLDADSKPIDNIIGEGELWFRCNTDFFNNMISYSVPDKNRDIMINFESQEALAGMQDEKEMKKKMHPILISYPEYKDDIKNFTEEFYMFFTMSTKQ